MKRLLLLIPVLLLSACATTSTKSAAQPAAKTAATTPPYTVTRVIISGKLHFPHYPQRPAFFDKTVKEGTPYEANFVFPYTAHDTNPSPAIGSFAFIGGPASSQIEFSHYQFMYRESAVAIFNNHPTAHDGFRFTTAHHHNVGGLHAVSIHARLQSKADDVLDSDQMPVRRGIPLSKLSYFIGMDFSASTNGHRASGDASMTGSIQTFHVQHR